MADRQSMAVLDRINRNMETGDLETYKYSIESEESPLNAARDTHLLLVGSQRSSGRSHLSSATLSNQRPVLPYDLIADAPDIGNIQRSALEETVQNCKGARQSQSPSLSPDGLLDWYDRLRNMNNSIALTTPADTNEYPPARIRRGASFGGKRLTGCTKRELLLIVLCVILIALLSITLFFYFGTAKDNTCQTVECVETSYKILSGMNKSADPCEDFYSYACGGWIEKHHIPPGTNSWTVFSELAQTAEYFAKDLLEKEATMNDSRGLRLAKIYYSSCVNEQAVNDLDLKPIKSALTQLFGGWRLLPKGTEGSRSENETEDTFRPGEYHLTELVQTFLRVGSGVDIFQLLIEKDPRNSRRYAITLAPGDPSMLPEYYLETSDPKIIKAVQYFREFMRTYAKMLGVPESQLSAMDDVFELETLMAKNMEPRARQSIETNFFKLNMTELQNFCHVIDWKRLFNGLFRDVNYTIADSETVIIGDYPFFEKRCKVYAEYLASPEKIKVIHDTAIWRTLWSTVTFMPSRVRKEIEAYEQATTGVKEQPQRWLSCVRSTEEYFGMTIARKFVTQHFDERSKAMATKMIRKIKMAFKTSFYQVDWMDDTAKKGSEEKVDKMNDSIGYPDDINDIEKENIPFFAVESLDYKTFFNNSYTLARSKALVLLRKLFDESLKTWDMAPHIVNAFYNPRENHIYFPAGILQKPFYDASYPLALNFGGIGVVVGHEIVHAFDRQGSKYDAEGNLRQWWSESTRADFEKNSECMVHQYGNYTVQGKNVDGHLTLSENIADNGGIKAAYRAFLKLQDEEEGKPQKLPGLNVTYNQLFFISFAQVWCKCQLPQAALRTVMFDVHAPERYRVIGALSNSEDFAKVFSCPQGSSMNPVDKCVLW